jgi:hypothetical protein
MSRAFVLAAAMSVMGCSSPISKDPGDYVGEYVYRPSDRPLETFPVQFASFVILKQDHVAVEIRFVRSTGQVLITKEKWHLLERGEGFTDDLVIGPFGAPIERAGSTIRLHINDDVDEYYEKVR